MKQMTTCLLSAVVGSVLTVGLLQTPSSIAIQAEDQPPLLAPRAQQPAKLPREELTPDEEINVSIYERVNKCVVNITTKTPNVDPFFMTQSESEGAGSGSVLNKEGHILTNFHVIQDASRAIVTLYDGKSYPATLVGADPVNDVAVIKIDAPPETLIPVSFGDSGRLKVGMRVIAIGNPFGLERTLTTGVISSLNRSLRIRRRTITSIIQTDAAINPGSSGGPLLDTRGRLIGMNTAIASSVGQSAGIGFAIPSSLIERIIPQLIMNGRVIRGDIGISRVYETDEGLLIEKLVPNGPADRAGLQGPKIIRRQDGFFVLQKIDRSAADIIVAVNGKKTPTAEEFLTIVERHKPGETVELTILRQGRTAHVKVQLGGDDQEKRNHSI
ncbi:Putative serine protease HtrA [Symmachiella dynata]|uniref:S1C family serine protease n=1 Tax=Symmachiella dynata TaxID=2527995 RepID=UPI00118D58F7|nr:trypsin-like peptidase domain-containing protein [Symmachiella dynata]QDT46291.1 Putative serine protease HtrA [Symmachiella dynata]